VGVTVSGILRGVLGRSFLLASLSLLCVSGSAQWTAPTPEELSMTSQSEVPGAAAVYLFREEITDDNLHYWSKYVRLKVLTEAGKEYANVELTQYQDRDSGGYTVADIKGRTIHPDGTIIPFTGKPFERLIEKAEGYKKIAKIFTLPGVEVGSIIEYRYELRYDRDRFIAPSWFVQSELYSRKAHYLWKPTDEHLLTRDERGGHLTSAVGWTPVLPTGFEVKQSREKGGGQATVELNIHDVPPSPDEEYMPPLGSLTYRVLFYYSPYRTADDYWKNEGMRWSRLSDNFIGPGPKVRDAVKELTVGLDTPEQKLSKLYATVMRLDNTSYSRDRSAAEEQAQGGTAKSTDDIWERKRGNDDQIAELFVAMARAAGMKAYVMEVVNRDRNLFIRAYPSFSQFDDMIAIVNIDGKERYFDPGERFCPFGHLAWKHAQVEGLRQVDDGIDFGLTPDEPYTASRTQRVAELTLNERGEAAGTIQMTWTGAPALNWRQRSLRGDRISLNHDLREAVERLMPAGLDAKVVTVENLEDYEKPLTVSYQVKGAIGTATGKRLLIPGDLFERNATPTFPHEKRQTAVYFDYPNIVQDAIRISFSSTFTVESIPPVDKFLFETFAFYSLAAESTPNTITVHRQLQLGNILYKQDEYPKLRAFYSKLEAEDQEPAVLKLESTPAAGN